MTSSILKPRSLAKNLSGLHTRLDLTTESAPYPYRTSQIDNGHIPFTSTLPLRSLSSDDSWISAFFFAFLSFSLLQIIIAFMWRYPFRQKHSHYSSLDFLSSLVPGVVEWIDHNSVSSLPTRNLMPCWAVFVPFHIFRAAIPTSKKTFNNCQYFRSISSGCWRKPKYILVVKIFTFFFSYIRTSKHHTMAYTLYYY